MTTLGNEFQSSRLVPIAANRAKHANEWIIRTCTSPLDGTVVVDAEVKDL